MLTHPDPSVQFVVEVDASDTGVGAVLSQRSKTDHKLHPCAFSRCLSPAECNYDVCNRTFDNSSSLTGMETVARGGCTSFHCMDRPQELVISSLCPQVKLSPGPVGSVSGPVQLHPQVQTRFQEYQAGHSLPSVHLHLGRDV